MVFLWTLPNDTWASRQVGEALPKNAKVAWVLDASDWDALLTLHRESSEAWVGRQPISITIDNTAKGLGVWRELLAHGTNLDWGRGNSLFLLWTDVDAKRSFIAGGVGWTKGGISPLSNPKIKWEQFELDGYVAYRWKGGNFCWASLGEQLVFGHCVSMKHQFRHLTKNRENTGALSSLIKRHNHSNGGIYWALDKPERIHLAKLLGLWGGFLNSVELGYLEERPGELAIRLVTGSPRAQDGVFQWLRGTLEIFAAEYSHLKARAHLDQALDIFQAKKLKRAVLRTDKRFKWSSDSLRLSKWGAPILIKRFPGDIEVSLPISDWRGYMLTVVSLLAQGDVKTPVRRGKARPEQVLFDLRKRQMAHRESTGRFVECGPIPTQIPQKDVPWPTKNCFEPLAFRPAKLVRYQIAAELLRGKLQLSLREKVDGAPVVWILGEDSKAPLRFPPL